MGHKSGYLEGNGSNDKPLIIVDDVEQKTGYWMGAARYATPEQVNVMIKTGKGLVYVCITEEKAEQLNLPLMTRHGSSGSTKKFTVSVDYKTTNTGISAYERADTIKALADDATESLDYRRPGHIFPLVGKANGLLERQSIVEGVLELSEEMSGQPVGYMCEILDDNGEIASITEIEQLARRHDVPIVWLSELIRKKLEEHCRLSMVRYAERETSGKPRKNYSEDQIVHFTDLLFVDYCEKQFGVNKGIYNTIESWFYKKGHVDIVERRKTVLRFLQFVDGSNRENNRKLKFGHRGLVPKLDEFTVNDLLNRRTLNL